MPTLNLPTAGGRLQAYLMQPPRNFPKAEPPFNRIAYAAAHVVADPLADREPWLDAAVDWDTTIEFRRHLVRVLTRRTLVTARQRASH